MYAERVTDGRRASELQEWAVGDGSVNKDVERMKEKLIEDG